MQGDEEMAAVEEGEEGVEGVAMPQERRGIER
jgi:hypothetical protein